jgi:septal ring factor EnvC (AmiA/AmiB activator)
MVLAVFLFPLNAPAQQVKKKQPTKKTTTSRTAPQKRPAVSSKSRTQQPVRRSTSRTTASRKPAAKKQVPTRTATARRRTPVRKPATNPAETQKSRQQLEQEKEQTQARIAELNKVLSRTSSTKQATLTELKALNQKIETQTKQIQLLNRDLSLLNVEVNELAVASTNLAADLKKLKKEYASMVYAASKTSNSYNKLSFLFSAPNFNALVMRYRYLRQYSDARRAQAKQIEEVRGELLAKRTSIQRKQQDKQQVLVAQVRQTEELETVKDQQTQVVQELSQQEAQLSAELTERKRAVARLNNQISAVIEREIRRAAERAAAEKAARERAERLAREEQARKERLAKIAAEEAAAKAAGKPEAEVKAETEEKVAKVEEAVKEEVKAEMKAEAAAAPAVSKNKIAMTPEETTLASSFAASKNRLPWPVRSGYISERFGLRPHPVLKGIMTENHGVDISTNPGEPVRAVYDGIVRDVTSLPGMGTVVAIQHGEFFTVYAKLTGVSVGTGQAVKARQTIGAAMPDKEGGAEINFQVWRNTSRMNPEGWLGGK